jgi:hypothetical protein
MFPCANYYYPRERAVLTDRPGCLVDKMDNAHCSLSVSSSSIICTFTGLQELMVQMKWGPLLT